MNGRNERGLAVRPLQALARFEERGGNVIVPAVSIYEMPDAFLVAADMPGAEKGSIQVRAESGALSIRAKVSRSGADVRVYSRRFVLTDGIDYNKSEAEFADGVLTVRLPKTSEVQARNIPVQGD